MKILNIYLKIFLRNTQVPNDFTFKYFSFFGNLFSDGLLLKICERNWLKTATFFRKKHWFSKCRKKCYGLSTNWKYPHVSSANRFKLWIKTPKSLLQIIKECDSYFYLNIKITKHENKKLSSHSFFSKDLCIFKVIEMFNADMNCNNSEPLIKNMFP